MTDSAAYVSLHKLTKMLRGLVPPPEQLRPDLLPQAGAYVVLEHFGRDLCQQQPVLYDIGNLTVASRGQPPSYYVRPSAIQVVHDTDLYSIPNEPPAILRRPGVIEAHRPETGDRLWGSFASLAWYTLPGGKIILIGATSGDARGGMIFAAPWAPSWSGAELDGELPISDSSALIDFLLATEHLEFARQAARFLLVLGLLEQVDGGPLAFEVDHKTGERKVRVAKGFAERKRLLDEPPLIDKLDPSQPLDPNARALVETMAVGHLRRTRFGPKREKVRWDYIQGYATRRWVAPTYTVKRDFAHTGLANSQLGYQPKKGNS